MISTHINNMRAKLRAGEIALGAGITLSDLTVTEALARSVDFVWIDMEHNATTTEAMLGHLIAARAGGAAALVRIPNNDVGWVKRVLDSGAEGIILPRAYSAREVAEFVSSCRYPPMGTRGFGPRRPMQYGRLGQAEYLQQANRDVFVTVQVETVELLAELDEVLKLEGLDSLVLGPQDLSGSMGRLGGDRPPRRHPRHEDHCVENQSCRQVHRRRSWRESRVRSGPDRLRRPVAASGKRLPEYMIQGCQRTFDEIRGVRPLKTAGIGRGLENSWRMFFAAIRAAP